MSNELTNKEKWVLLFREIGLDDGTMSAWHKAFESRFPDLHQSFLEWLEIPEDKIRLIRGI